MSIRLTLLLSLGLFAYGNDLPSYEEAFAAKKASYQQKQFDDDLISYTVVNTYPSDVNSFTQGIEYTGDNQIIISKGLFGSSAVRLVQLDNHLVWVQKKLPSNVFGEGVAQSPTTKIIYQLTWVSGLIYKWEDGTLNSLGTIPLPSPIKEGWGITHDGEQFIISDGTSTIYFCTEGESSLTVTRSIKVANGRTLASIDRLNELEYINGLIYANKWLTDDIYIIDPATGFTVGRLNFATQADAQFAEDTSLISSGQTLNGVAYRPDTGNLLITGKMYSKIYEVKLADMPQPPPTTAPPTIKTRAPTIAITREPTEPPTRRPTRSPTNSPTEATQEEGFDWGSGCPAGDGAFKRTMPRAGEVVDIGIIPAGKWEVFVELATDDGDIDIQLYDINDKTKFSEGTAIVGWCDNPSQCNFGKLAGCCEEFTSYVTSTAVDGQSMTVTYSGYNGVDQKVGYEFIRITGETTSDLMMAAFAYSAGTADVTYSWGRSQSGCCQGTEACTGFFQRKINEGSFDVVGTIPIGKINVEVYLKTESSDEDVDIQLYDTEDTSFPEGLSIIGWIGCGFITPTCNFGKYAGAGLGSVDHFGVNYQYSGYNGDGTGMGNEFIRLTGETNKELMMKVFGYKSGTATVTYQWFEKV